jgi:hypothetical protein
VDNLINLYLQLSLKKLLRKITISPTNINFIRKTFLAHLPASTFDETTTEKTIKTVQNTKHILKNPATNRFIFLKQKQLDLLKTRNLPQKFQEKLPKKFQTYQNFNSLNC